MPLTRRHVPADAVSERFPRTGFGRWSHRGIGALVLGCAVAAVAGMRWQDREPLVEGHANAGALQNVPAPLQPVAPPASQTGVGVLASPFIDELEQVRARSLISQSEFGARFSSASDELGSLSIGRPNRGRLFNGVHLQDGPSWYVVNPEHAYGTAETLLALVRSIHSVASEFPNTPPLAVGDLSARRGGWITPHKSHQSGRDVDVGLYYARHEKWYTKATPSNLDAPRVWALVEAMYRTGQLEYVFFDRSLHATLRAAAQARNADPAIVACVFDGCEGQDGTILRHAWGHRTHLHVRFRSPDAVAGGQRAQSLAGAAGARAPGLLALLERRSSTRPVPERQRAGTREMKLALHKPVTRKAVARGGAHAPRGASHGVRAGSVRGRSQRPSTTD